MEDILVVKQKGNKLKLKISKKRRNKYAEPLYRKILNPRDPNDLALFLGDLKLFFNTPVNKAFKIFRKDVEELGEHFFMWGENN